MPKRDQIFVSYSHLDAEHLQRMNVHFKPFERQYSINVWSDKKIQAGQKWREEIKQALQQTAVAILLVSADFLASDFVANEELPPLLDAAESEGVSILCFILSPCAFSATSLSKYQAVNNPSKPLTSLNKKAQRDVLWVDLVQKATQALEQFKVLETAAKAVQTVPASKGSISWDKVATLFWLGNDLMWIQDMTYRHAAPDTILQGIDNAMTYVKGLGFDGASLPATQLRIAKQAVKKLIGVSTPVLEARELQQQRTYLRVRTSVETIKWFLHGLASQKESGFVKGQVFPQFLATPENTE